MIPYFTLHAWHVSGLTVTPFVLLLIAAILTGFSVAVRHARRYGVSREQIAELSIWMVACGLVGALLFKMLYVPEILRGAIHPPGHWLRLRGISSFGGLFGGCLALLLYFWRRRLDSEGRLAILDALGFAMPFAWALGRMGCALAHDHPGIASQSILAVAYPRGARYDLGLLEVFFHLLLAAGFLLLNRSRRPAGFYFAAFFCAYGPFRFLLDGLHVDPPRYFGWTVDAYASVLATLIGLLAAAAILRTEQATVHIGKSSCEHVFSTL